MFPPKLPQKRGYSRTWATSCLVKTMGAPPTSRVTSPSCQDWSSPIKSFRPSLERYRRTYILHIPEGAARRLHIGEGQLGHRVGYLCHTCLLCRSRPFSQGKRAEPKPHSSQYYHNLLSYYTIAETGLQGVFQIFFQGPDRREPVRARSIIRRWRDNRRGAGTGRTGPVRRPPA